MKDYSKKSDQEINIEIAEMFGVYWNLSPDKSASGGWEYCKKPDICEANSGKETVKLPDYCNNPSDAWPIIVENGISINHGGMLVDGKWIDYWYCGDGNGNCCNGESPLRAAMIVYLMIKDEEK